MKNLIALVSLLFILLSLWKCNDSDKFPTSKERLTAHFTGFTEIFTGDDKSKKIDSLTPECFDGLDYLNFRTLLFNNDTLKWSTIDNDSREKGYLVYKTEFSNDTLYCRYIGIEINGIIKNDFMQDDIILIKNEDGFSTPFYYLKRTFHQQFFSFLPLEPLKKDYINTLDTITDTLKYWTIQINFR